MIHDHIGTLCYGAIGSPHFRLYDNRSAEAITISGQCFAQMAGRNINKYLNKVLATDNKDFVIFGDTDSIGVDFGSFVNKFGSSDNINKNVDLLDKWAETKGQEILSNTFNVIYKDTNSFVNRAFMKREKIYKGVFIAKKKYILRVYDNEGTRYATPKLACTGVESVKNGTPKWVRGKLEETYENIFNHDEIFLRKFLEKVKEEYLKLPLSSICPSIGVNDIDKHLDEYGNIKVGTGAPYNVKASHFHNSLVDSLGLSNEISKIKNKDKIKIAKLVQPNPYRKDSVGFIGELPKQFKIDKWIDRDSSFEKTYLEPMRRVLTAIGWSDVEQTSLDDFFG